MAAWGFVVWRVLCWLCGGGRCVDSRACCHLDTHAHTHACHISARCPNHTQVSNADEEDEDEDDDDVEHIQLGDKVGERRGGG